MIFDFINKAISGLFYNWEFFVASSTIVWIIYQLIIDYLTKDFYRTINMTRFKIESILNKIRLDQDYNEYDEKLMHDLSENLFLRYSETKSKLKYVNFNTVNQLILYQYMLACVNLEYSRTIRRINLINYKRQTKNKKPLTFDKSSGIHKNDIWRETISKVGHNPEHLDFIVKSGDELTMHFKYKLAVDLMIGVLKDDTLNKTLPYIQKNSFNLKLYWEDICKMFSVRSIFNPPRLKSVRGSVALGIEKKQ